MSSNIKITKILNSPAFATSVFLASGIHKTYQDYKNADDKYKTAFLVKDAAVLGGATAGMLVSANIHLLTKNLAPVKNTIDKLANKLKDKIHINALDNKYVQNSFNYAKEIVTNTFLNCSLFVCGVIGAMLTDSVLSKLKIESLQVGEKTESQKPYENSIEKYIDNKLNKYVGEDNKEIIFNRIYDMPQLKMFSPTIIGEESLKLSKENDMKKKLKHTTSSLINNSLIPMFLLSVATVLTRKLNGWLRIPTIFAFLVAGTKGINYLREKILDKRDKKQIS